VAGRVDIPADLRRRRAESEKRTARLKTRIARLGADYDLSKVCIYATGSYGRGESSRSSDIDLFLLDVAPSAKRLGHLDQTLRRRIWSDCAER